VHFRTSSNTILSLLLERLLLLMKTWARKTISVGVLAAGALLFAPSAAHAVDQVATDNTGLLNATQIVAPINAPISIAGIGAGILGDGVGAGQVTGSGSTESGHARQSSTDNTGALNGTQAYVPVNVPVSVAGVGVGVLGNGAGEGSVSNNTESGHAASQDASDNTGALNATQVYLPVNLPISLAGVGVGILGDGAGSGTVSNGGTHGYGASESGATQSSTGNTGAANGTQVYAPLNLPISLAGVGIGVLGDGQGAGTVSNENGNGGGGASQTSDDNTGVANGTQVYAPVNAPVCVAGIGLGILGDGHGAGSCDNGGDDTDGGNGGDNDGDDDGDDDGDNDGDGGSDGYGDQARSHARTATREATPVDGLTSNLTGQAANVGGLGLLNTLR
jgi:hypothetical protein